MLNYVYGVSSSTASGEMHVSAFEVEHEATAHFILKVTDRGNPPLSRYKRVVLTIKAI